MKPRAASLFVRRCVVVATFATVLLTYDGLAERASREGALLAPTQLDAWLPTVPLAVLVYAAYYPLLLAVFLDYCRARDFRQAYAVTVGIVLASFSVFLAWPTYVERPALPSSWGSALLAGLWSLDAPGNCLPSLHVSLTVWAAHLAVRRGRVSARVAFVGTALISLSTMLTKQHIVIDVLGGLALGLGAAVGYGAWTRRRVLASASVLAWFLVSIPVAIAATAGGVHAGAALEQLGDDRADEAEADRPAAAVDATAALASLARGYDAVPEIPTRGGRPLNEAQQVLLDRCAALARDASFLAAIERANPRAEALSEPDLKLAQDVSYRFLMRSEAHEPARGWLLGAPFLGTPAKDTVRRRLDHHQKLLLRIAREALHLRDPAPLQKSLDDYLTWIGGPETTAWLLRAVATEKDAVALPRDLLPARGLFARLVQGEVEGADAFAQAHRRELVAFVKMERTAALARVALRLSCFRREKGHWPRTYAELTEYAGVELPRDPLSGEPLRYNGGSLEMYLAAPAMDATFREIRWPN